jgi:SAM-dependent methyltransferase
MRDIAGDHTGGGPCWVCGAHGAVEFKASNVDESRLRDTHFRITAADYGRTPRLVRCGVCGFIQIAQNIEVLDFYRTMEDPDYEATRRERALQARELLKLLGAPGSEQRLLDVGAGSGVLVEEALALGWRAEGVEPSVWLADQARARGLPVSQGVLPMPSLAASFDVACLVDVIEHVTDPRGLLAEVRKVIRPNGRLLVVTPDVRSVAARVLGGRWWHYRVAHVGYFDRRTLDRVLRDAGFTPEGMKRPTWYFPVSYVVERLAHFVPPLGRLELPAALGRVSIPLNLFDSLAAIYRVRAQ